MLAFNAIKPIDRDEIIQCLSSSTNDHVRNILTNDTVHPADLLHLLPRYTRHASQTIVGAIYVIIGSHQDGRWLVYVGSSSNLASRLIRHAYVKNGIRNGTAAADQAQTIHHTLGQPGWTDTYHIAADFTSSLRSKHLHGLKVIIETLWILLLGTLQTSRGKP